MYGLIVSGHGSFASGLKSNVELIAGKRNNLIAIDFYGDISLDELESKYNIALKELENYSKIYFLVDLKGGSPFNIAKKLLQLNDKISIITGINSPTLLELIMSDDIIISQEELKEKILIDQLGVIIVEDREVIFDEEDEM